MSDQKKVIIEPENMGKSVTPHVRITNPSFSSDFLSCGIDSLDVGFYVSWELSVFTDIVQTLEQAKLLSRKTQAPALPDSPLLNGCLVHPTAKKMYSYHLEQKGFHLYLASLATPKSYPNIMVSFNAKMLWYFGYIRSVANVTTFIESLSGKISQVKVSRCDICADFRITPELSADFIKCHSVPNNRKTRIISQGDTLETYYIGSSKSMIQARLYNKSEEIKTSNKYWFKFVWKTDYLEHIWRLEFQLRREALKAYGINHPSDIKSKLGGMWEDLTSNWFTLRLHDDTNTSRRTIHPLWQEFQNCKYKFGEFDSVTRDLKHDTAGAEFYLTRAANNLLGFAAVTGLECFSYAISVFMYELSEYWKDKGFEAAYKAKNIILNGQNSTGEGIYE